MMNLILQRIAQHSMSDNGSCGASMRDKREYQNE